MVTKTKYEAQTSFPFWGNKKGAFISDLESGNYNVRFVSAKQGNYTVKITKK